MTGDHIREDLFTLEKGGDYMYYQSNELLPGRTTLLFIHGLGESGLCFREIFHYPQFNEYNILIPDLVGCGRSSAASGGDYRYAAHVKRLRKFIKGLIDEDIILVGHSMGGDLATLLSHEDKDGRIKALVNIEGDLTQDDIFISSEAVDAYRDGIFEQWYHKDFMIEKVLKEWGGKYESCQRYYASLQFCRPDAFLLNSQELVHKNTELSKAKYQSKIGDLYSRLKIPKIFCYGTESIESTSLTREYIIEKDLEVQAFDKAFHWLMIDQSEEFYPFLYGFMDRSPE